MFVDDFFIDLRYNKRKMEGKPMNEGELRLNVINKRLTKEQEAFISETEFDVKISRFKGKKGECIYFELIDTDQCLMDIPDTHYDLEVNMAEGNPVYHVRYTTSNAIVSWVAGDNYKIELTEDMQKEVF